MAQLRTAQRRFLKALGSSHAVPSLARLPGALQVQCTAHVADDIDRDRVRFWRYPLPELPPKMQPADAILIADVQRRTPHLSDALPALPALLKRHGVVVVVLPAAAAVSPAAPAPAPPTPGTLSQELVARAFDQAGLKKVAEQRFEYTTGVPGADPAAAHATVWRFPSAAH